MKQEYQLLIGVACWIIIWTFAPIFISLPLFIVYLVYCIRKIRRQRRFNEMVNQLHQNDRKWANLEGFEGDVAEKDESDWWKRM